MNYTTSIIEDLKSRYAEQTEFVQAATEVLSTIQPVLDAHPEYQQQSLLERLVEPERVIMFRVPWVDDAGKVHVNRGYRIEFNSAIGPYKGGLRFHPSVNLSILKFLGFEQIFKNSLTGLPMGGGKGGADFDPKGKSDQEVMAFCQSFITELYRHIGCNTDVPAGDIGVGAREIGFMFGQYKRLKNEWDGTITGKGLAYGGSLARKEATGYGAVYFADTLLKDQRSESIYSKNVNISGAGNVAIYAAEKAQALGAIVQTMSDSKGWIYDPEGIDVEAIKRIKEIERASLETYLVDHPKATYKTGAGAWEVPCDIYMPCATQNELDETGAKILAQNGCSLVVEGANMPTTAKAGDFFAHEGIVLCPGKAANAGGVSVSGLEMAQNAGHIAWSFEKVDAMLQDIMANIYTATSEAAQRYATPQDMVAGANIAGFVKVAEAMSAQGIV